MGCMMRYFAKYFTLFLWGGFIYYLIEVLYRGHSFASMFVVGGICFLLIGLINNLLEWDTPLLLQMLYAAICVTVVEFFAGCILNVWLGLGIWDYSNMPLNIAGQVCLPYMALWYLLSLPAILLDDYLRYWIFDEQAPRYGLWHKIR